MNIQNTIDQIFADKYLSRLSSNTVYYPYKFRTNLDNANICTNAFTDFIREKYFNKIKIDESFCGTNWDIRYYFDKDAYFNCKINVFEAVAIKIELDYCVFKFHNWAKALKFLICESDSYLKLIKANFNLTRKAEHLTLKICKECGLTDFNFSHDDHYVNYYFNPKKNTKYFSKNGEA